jgi:transposase
MDRRELRQYEAWKEEAQLLRAQNQHLRLELMACRPALYRADQRVDRLEQRLGKLEAENRRLRRRVKELTAAASSPPGPAPASRPSFVKPPVRGRRKRPGRKKGHAAALRPVPDHVDVHQDVPLPKDGAGRAACPRCNCRLTDVKGHERLVEDIVPSKVVVACYHTASGYCAMCRRRVESRAPEQPPAADVPHGQLGLNALATAAVLRVVHRLPFGQVVRVLADLPGLGVSAGGISRQLRRLGEWLDPYYERVKLALRVAPRVNGDETGWRTDGRNGYLWAVTDPKHTLYHVDRRRSGDVIERLLGRTFPGTLTSDFYGAYGRLDCPKQRCLAHLLRELRDTAEKHPAFAQGSFCRKSVRLVKDMLGLKRKWDELGDGCYTRRACRIEDRLDQLAGAGYDEPHAARLAARMSKHRGELTRFLWDRDLDGTNNAAERALRPAVVMRKITGGSRSAKGAEAWAKLASLTRTASQQGRNVLETVKQLLTEHWAGKPPMALTSGP